jgi:CRISPR-associated protein Csm2
MSYGNQRGHGRHQGGGRHQTPAIDLNGVKLKAGDGALDANLFSATAERIAKTIGENKNSNKPSQIRQFYNELVMWEERARQNPDRFAEYLPFIRMLNAKAAYAKGRGNVDENFVALIAHCLEQVDDTESLRNFKLFFEAFLGFYKLHGPKG